MDGVLIIDKPAGITSHDVVSRVRRILKTRRVGHTGTLDPFATGVLVVLVGQATRLAQFLDKDKKEYEALVRFGYETDTADVTGSRITDSQLSDQEVASRIASADWNDIFDVFRGEIEQVPPMFSAKKVAGKKLYEHARSGETIDRKKINVAIHKLELVDQSQISNLKSEIIIRVACSAGTYIRTLAEDIGRKIGIGAHLSELRRTRAGKFTIGQSVTLDELEHLAEPHKGLIAMKEAVSHLPTFILPDDRVDKTRNGLSTRIFESEFEDGLALQMLDSDGNLLAIGLYNEAENSVQPKVVLV
ncbi:MAG: tRNA pseudouridine(55) synthase TruB [Pyrinomonadaceae bacterium]